MYALLHNLSVSLCFYKVISDQCSDYETLLTQDGMKF